MSLSRKKQTKMIVKQMRKIGEEVARDAEHGRDRVRHRRRDLLGSGLHVLGGPTVAEPGQLVGLPQLLDDRRQLLEEVAYSADERHEEQERDHEHRDGGAEHRDGRGKPARHARLRHHEAHRILEHERQEDPDEHEQERVADRPERREHAGRRGNQQHGSHRQDSSTRRGVSVGSATGRCAALTSGGSGLDSSVSAELFGPRCRRPSYRWHEARQASLTGTGQGGFDPFEPPSS